MGCIPMPHSRAASGLTDDKARRIQEAIKVLAESIVDSRGYKGEESR